LNPTLGAGSFTFAAPAVWSSLPADLCVVMPLSVLTTIGAGSFPLSLLHQLYGTATI